MLSARTRELAVACLPVQDVFELLQLAYVPMHMRSELVL